MKTSKERKKYIKIKYPEIPRKERKAMIIIHHIDDWRLYWDMKCDEVEFRIQQLEQRKKEITEPLKSSHSDEDTVLVHEYREIEMDLYLAMNLKDI